MNLEDNNMNTRLKTTRRLTCTAIVCAYNEEKSLQGVLEALMTTEFVDEIMAVDDGSRAGWNGGRVIRGIYFSPNRGKGHAMAEAAARARGDILLYVDADLLNWNAGYAAQLLEPLLTKEAAMTIGYPVREDDDPDRRFPFLHWIAGQRAVWREDLRPFLDVIRGSRFGVETLINLYYRARGKHVELVPMHGLIHPVKGEKEKPLKAAGLYWREGQEIGLAVTRYYPLLLRAYGLKTNTRSDSYRPVPLSVRAEQIIRWTRRAMLNTGNAVDELRGAV
jgi:glycosyltransferase involved in cell wall biosynthesis